MGAVCSSDTVPTCKSARCYNPEDQHQHLNGVLHIAYTYKIEPMINARMCVIIFNRLL
jgi:hypothetical protein